MDYKPGKENDGSGKIGGVEKHGIYKCIAGKSEGVVGEDVWKRGRAKSGSTVRAGHAEKPMEKTTFGTQNVTTHFDPARGEVTVMGGGDFFS